MGIFGRDLKRCVGEPEPRSEATTASGERSEHTPSDRRERDSPERSESTSAAGEDLRGRRRTAENPCRRAQRAYHRRRQGSLEVVEDGREPLSSSAARLPAPQARTLEAVAGRPRTPIVEQSEKTSAAGKDTRGRR